MVKASIGSKVKSCLISGLSYNLKVTEANLMKIYRKIKHNMVCHIQDLSSHFRAQSHC